MASQPKLRWGVFLLIALAALVLRLPGLGTRPMHTDESVNAYIVGQVLAGAAFHYDPVDRHGPALVAFAWPMARLEGVRDFAGLTEAGLRIVPVIAGTVTVLLFAAAVEALGFLSCLVAAVVFAVAPLSVYYSRDFIHETIFVAATLGVIAAGWRVVRRSSAIDAAMAGACAALMLAAKETAVLHFFVFAVAACVVLFVWGPVARPGGLQMRALLIAGLAFVALSLLLFTWFGQNWKVFHDFVQAAPDAMHRAHGQGHEKPFWYYFQLLAGGWSGAVLCLLALAGFVFAICAKVSRGWRWVAFYLLLITAVYCLIPYKTPWLALNLLLPAALLMGLAVEMLWRAASRPVLRVLIVVFCVVICGLVAHDTRKRVFVDSADESNPYAYVQTSEDLLGLPDRLNELVRQRHLANPRIAVIASDPWPLPWYLRKYPQTGFWQPRQQVDAADFFVTSTEAAEQYKEQFKDFMPEFFGVRPNVLIILWVPAER